MFLWRNDRNKSTTRIMATIKKWTEEHMLEKLITNNSKEFANQELEDFYYSNSISHHKVSVEGHNSNERIETAIRILRESVLQSNEDIVRSKTYFSTNTHKGCYHKGSGVSLMNQTMKRAIY